MQQVARAWWRSAAATLTGPARLSTPITRLRRAAMTPGVAPVRTCTAAAARPRIATSGWRRPAAARGGRDRGQAGQQVRGVGVLELARIGLGQLGQRGWDRG
jgi:hypothetical protein